LIEIMPISNAAATASAAFCRVCIGIAGEYMGNRFATDTTSSKYNLIGSEGPTLAPSEEPITLERV
jgi:hypothetical protein